MMTDDELNAIAATAPRPGTAAAPTTRRPSRRRSRTREEAEWIEQYLSTLPDFGPETRERVSWLLGQLRAPAVVASSDEEHVEHRL